MKRMYKLTSLHFCKYLKSFIVQKKKLNQKFQVHSNALEKNLFKSWKNLKVIKITKKKCHNPDWYTSTSFQSCVNGQHRLICYVSYVFQMIGEKKSQWFKNFTLGVNKKSTNVKGEISEKLITHRSPKWKISLLTLPILNRY